MSARFLNPNKIPLIIGQWYLLRISTIAYPKGPREILQLVAQLDSLENEKRPSFSVVRDLTLTSDNLVFDNDSFYNEVVKGSLMVQAHLVPAEPCKEAKNG